MISPGYSHQTLATNIERLQQQGYPRLMSIREAYNGARKSYFRRYPQGLLPEWLAFPKGKRRAEDYRSDGSPVFRGANPVDDLDMSPAELKRIERATQDQLSGQGAQVRQAANLYTKFTGHPEVSVSKVMIPDMPETAVEIGTVDGILYTTKREGRTEKYIHHFKRTCRPLFCVSPDGKQLYMIGGSYTFGDRGIIDKG